MLPIAILWSEAIRCDAFGDDGEYCNEEEATTATLDIIIIAVHGFVLFWTIAEVIVWEGFDLIEERRAEYLCLPRRRSSSVVICAAAALVLSRELPSLGRLLLLLFFSQHQHFAESLTNC